MESEITINSSGGGVLPHQHNSNLELSVPPHGKIQIIQILRMVGATVVFASHFFRDEAQIIEGLGFNGRLGVGIFFTISGFLLSYTDNGNFNGFIRKKIIRICPLYWLTTVVTFTIGLLAPHLLNTSVANFPNLLKSVLFIPYSSGGQIFPLNPVGWTLIVEMFVYILYDGVAAISKTINEQNILKGVYFRGLLTVAILCLLVLLGQLLPETPFTIAYCRAYMLHFAIGVIGALFVKRNQSSYDKLREELEKSSWLGKAIPVLILIVLAMGSTRYEETIISALILSVITLTLVILLQNVDFPKIYIRLGDVSYSFYLLHYFVVKVFTRLLTKHLALNGSLLILFMAGICYFTATIISFFCYQWIEIKFATLLRKRWIPKT